MDLQLPPDFKEFLKLLKDHDVRYLLFRPPPASPKSEMRS